MEIEIKLSDLKKIIYWTICKFKADKFHKQASSAKSDLIGGFIDRWINRLPEMLIFNKLLENKDYKAVVDNFLYNQETEKNAPDILGLQTKTGRIIKFAVFENGKWVQCGKAPFIEVKTFRNTQYLTSVPKTQFKSDHYYVFVESNIKEDYLVNVFDKSVFSEEIRNSIAVNEAFIKFDIGNQIMKLPELKIDEKLGSLKLIGIFEGKTVEECSILAETDKSGKPEKPRYFKKITEIADIYPQKEIYNEYDEEIREGIFKENNYVPFYIKKMQENTKITIKRKKKSYFIVEVQGKADINGNVVKSGYYKIEFEIFDRSSKKSEYIGDKILFEKWAEKSENNLVKIFDDLISDTQ
jgi:hypothetical protein